MWSGFDPELQRQYDYVRRVARLQRLTPTKERSLVFIEEQDLLFVIREWPNGEVTAYATANCPSGYVS